MYLPEGCARPSPAALERFWADARVAVPALAAATEYQVRWIGLDASSTRQILDLIRAGDKTGTFTLPWIVEATGEPAPRVGDRLVLIDYDGRPVLVVRTTHVHAARFGSVTAADTAIDGSPVRALEVWKPLHTQYWNALLAPFGRAVDDEMPFWVERFELVYDADAARG
jgi:uncharacterized protein YhfF